MDAFTEDLNNLVSDVDSDYAIALSLHDQPGVVSQDVVPLAPIDLTRILQTSVFNALHKTAIAKKQEQMEFDELDDYDEEGGSEEEYDDEDDDDEGSDEGSDEDEDESEEDDEDDEDDEEEEEWSGRVDGKYRDVGGERADNKEDGEGRRRLVQEVNVDLSEFSGSLENEVEVELEVTQGAKKMSSKSKRGESDEDGKLSATVGGEEGAFGFSDSDGSKEDGDEEEEDEEEDDGDEWKDEWDAYVVVDVRPGDLAHLHANNTFMQLAKRCISMVSDEQSTADSTYSDDLGVVTTSLAAASMCEGDFMDAPPLSDTPAAPSSSTSAVEDLPTKMKSGPESDPESEGSVVLETASQSLTSAEEPVTDTTKDVDTAAVAATVKSSAPPAEYTESFETSAFAHGSFGKPAFGGVDGQHSYFSLPILYEPLKTGFQASKELSVHPGMVIAGRYKVADQLGAGQAAFSVALQCIDLLAASQQQNKPAPECTTDSDKAWVCLKVIKNNKDYLDQSLDEIKLLQFLNREDPDEKHLLRLQDFFYYKEHLVIVSELLCENLYEFGRNMKESGMDSYFTLNRIKKISFQVLEALQYVHSLNLIHCDIKPENIVMKSYSRCEIKLIDFGSSCFITDNLTSYIQSRSYRAPEVILGVPYDGRIDVWSFGAVVAELLTGCVLFQNDSVTTMLARIAGILGPLPMCLLEGTDASKYIAFEHGVGLFTEEDERGRTKIIYPKRSTLAARMNLNISQRQCEELCAIRRVSGSNPDCDYDDLRAKYTVCTGMSGTGGGWGYNNESVLENAQSGDKGDKDDGEGGSDRDSGSGTSSEVQDEMESVAECVALWHFIREMLCLDPSNRATCTRLLTHTFLRDALTVPVAYKRK